jgi:hypothetical protein
MKPTFNAAVISSINPPLEPNDAENS